MDGNPPEKTSSIDLDKLNMELKAMPWNICWEKKTNKQKQNKNRKGNHLTLQKTENSLKSGIQFLKSD